MLITILNPTTSLQQSIHHQCPNMTPAAIELSLKAYNKARAAGFSNKDTLTIIDFTQPSYKERMCTVQLSTGKVLLSTLVAHGVKSGNALATSFSNQINSHKSMIGLYLTGSTYYGKSGLSLHLYGLDKGFNDNAAKRNVVMHGSAHVSEMIAKKRHKIGNTLGCLGISKDVSEKSIHILDKGTLIFVYYPDNKWLKTSWFLSP